MDRHDRVNSISEAFLLAVSKLLDAESYEHMAAHMKQITDSVNIKEQLSDRLSASEMEIAGMIAEGATSKEISERLLISKKTVDYHRTNIRKKLKLSQKDNLQQHLRRLI